MYTMLYMNALKIFLRIQKICISIVLIFVVESTEFYMRTHSNFSQNLENLYYFLFNLQNFVHSTYPFFIECSQFCYINALNFFSKNLKNLYMKCTIFFFYYYYFFFEFTLFFTINISIFHQIYIAWMFICLNAHRIWMLTCWIDAHVIYDHNVWVINFRHFSLCLFASLVISCLFRFQGQGVYICVRTYLVNSI